MKKSKDRLSGTRRENVISTERIKKTKKFQYAIKCKITETENEQTRIEKLKKLEIKTANNIKNRKHRKRVKETQEIGNYFQDKDLDEDRKKELERKPNLRASKLQINHGTIIQR